MPSKIVQNYSSILPIRPISSIISITLLFSSHSENISGIHNSICCYANKFICEMYQQKKLQRNKRKIWNGRDIAKICNNLITRCINHVFVKQSTKFKATCSKFKSAVENLISVCFRPFASKIL